MVAPAAVSRPPGAASSGAAGDDRPQPVIGVRLYAVPTPEGLALVAPESALADLRDVGYILADYPAAIRVDLLGAAPLAEAVEEADVLILLRRSAVVATTAADSAGGRLSAVGPLGAWYATVLVWAWLLLLFAGQNVVQVAGALWLIAGLPWARRAYRRRLDGWGRRGADGLAAVNGPVEVRCLAHAGLARLAALMESAPNDPLAACREAARACPSAGVSDLSAFYAALAAGTPPALAWLPVVRRPSPAAPQAVLDAVTSGPAPREADETLEREMARREGPEGETLRTSSTPI